MDGLATHFDGLVVVVGGGGQNSRVNGVVVNAVGLQRRLGGMWVAQASVASDLINIAISPSNKQGRQCRHRAALHVMSRSIRNEASDPRIAVAAMAKGHTSPRIISVE